LALDDLFQVVREVVAEHFPGDTPEEVSITLRNAGRKRWSVPPVRPVASPPPEEAVEGVPAELAAAILDRLADTCKRHTREEMSAALAEVHSESAVHKALWKLRTAGKLSNRKDGHGLGFGLPEWS
jgi:hypothetical protein